FRFFIVILRAVDLDELAPGKNTLGAKHHQETVLAIRHVRALGQVFTLALHGFILFRRLPLRRTITACDFTCGVDRWRWMRPQRYRLKSPATVWQLGN